MTLFAFSGPIGSGKSNVSQLFAATIGGTWNSFGNAVRTVAVERGVPTDREGLQRLGAELVANERSSFCRRVVGQPSSDSEKPVVIDGLRHFEILEELRVVANPRNVVCVYVDAPLAIRLQRVNARDGLSADQLAKLQKHSTEVEVEQRLKSIADFCADNQSSPQQCVESILSWAKGRHLV